MSGNNSHLMREVRLWDNHAEREQIENVAELFAVLNTLEHLEKMYNRRHVTAEEYQSECFKLIDEYKTAKLLVPNISVEEFCKKYRLECPLALERIQKGRPATTKDDKGNLLSHVAGTVEQFITLADALRLNTRAVDDLFPGINDLVSTINASRVPIEPIVHEKLGKWKDLLSTMSASSEISEDEARQMTLDVDLAYASVRNTLNSYYQH